VRAKARGGKMGRKFKLTQHQQRAQEGERFVIGATYCIAWSRLVYLSLDIIITNYHVYRFAT
jgi:hypothetical protein